MSNEILHKIYAFWFFIVMDARLDFQLLKQNVLLEKILWTVMNFYWERWFSLNDNWTWRVFPIVIIGNYMATHAFVYALLPHLPTSNINNLKKILLLNEEAKVSHDLFFPTVGHFECSRSHGASFRACLSHIYDRQCRPVCICFPIFSAELDIINNRSSLRLLRNRI